MKKSGQEASLCCPGESGWQRWVAKGLGQFELAEELSLEEAPDGPAEFRESRHYAFPAEGVHAAPLWVATVEQDMFEDLAGLHLEKFGLRPDGGEGKLMDIDTVELEESRALLLASILAKGVTHPLPTETPREFAPSPRFFPVPKDCAAIWRELGKLILVVNRGRELCYFQALTSPEIDEFTASEIRCILLQLEGQGVLQQLDRLHLWLDDCPPDAAAALQENLGIEVAPGKKPNPTLPDEPCGLVPTDVAEKKRREARAKRLRIILAALAGLYIIGMGIWIGNYARIQLKANALEAEVAAKQDEFDLVNETRRRYDALKPAIEPEFFPVETMYNLFERLPPRGIRFKQIDITPEQVFVSAEAVSQPVALSYQNQVKKSAALGKFEWSAPPPTPNRQGRADFKLTGKPIVNGSPQI